MGSLFDLDLPWSQQFPILMRCPVEWLWRFLAYAERLPIRDSR
jgi:uncharacterized membrane protein YeiB